ncbi:transposable element Tcb2 transposase [Trichonephila clavipes]|nr:transposable element Tcb2 transposase [Trichonephila clavipes]
MDSDDDINYESDSKSDAYADEECFCLDSEFFSDSDKMDTDDEFSYTVLSTADVVDVMLNLIKEVNTVVGIPPTTIRILLNHFNWDPEKLYDKYYKDWSMDQWVTVLFSDQSWFSLTSDFLCTFIRREPGTHYLSSNVRKIDHYSRGGLIVWACVMLDEHTHFQVFERGNVIAERYRDEVFDSYVYLFRVAIGPDFIFRDDNMKSRRARLFNEFLESEDIRRMDWPARSPDFNPIEQG